MPGDPTVNDHYGDVLWKNGQEIQARYYWNNVLSLEKTEDKLKEKIKEKLIKGIQTVNFNSYAKINLSLTVNAKLKNGLHEIQSYYCLVDLADKIKINRTTGYKTR